MFGVAQHTMWLVFGVILLILTGALFYIILPHSDCDRMATVSANEVKSAIECAAKYADGIDPVTGEKCNVASVRLCQEDSFSIYGIGFVQAYMGLMVPEYMIYYQQFPTRTYESLLKGGTWGFTESYPFERAYVGQRPYDIRPTLTQFKQFFKTKYLQEPCTSDTALCFNTRGREEVVRVEGDIPDVRLQRSGLGFAEDNPKFYLVAPCYAKVTFKKGDDGKIYGRPERLSVSGASNYCFADETALGGLMATYAGETGCEAGMIALDFLSLGSKKAVEESAEVAAKVTIKAGSKAVARTITKEVVEGVLKRFGKKLGKEAEEAAAAQVTKTVMKKVAVKDVEEEVAQEAIEAAARKGLQKMEMVSGKKFTALEREIIVKEATENVLEESAEETLEKAMSKAVDRGFRKAKIAAGEMVSEEEATMVEKVGTEEVVEEFSTMMGKKMRTGLKGLSSATKATLVGKAFLKRYATMESMPTKKADILLQAFGIVPCVDVDLCRAASACGETLMWPGFPFAELTDAKMKGGKPMDTVSDVFNECCIQLNYGAETDTDRINCTEPDFLVSLVKADLKLDESDALTLTKAGEYLGLAKDKIPAACSLAKGDNSKDCRDAAEMTERHMTDNCLADVSEHTYDFGDVKQAGQVTVMARLYRDDCPAETNLILEISNDTHNWVEANRMRAEKYPADNFIYIHGSSAFRYLRVREDGACYFDSTSVVIDPLGSRIIEAQPNTKYELSAGTYNYFTVPAGYMSNAAALCMSVSKCTSVAKWVEEGGWLKWADEGAGPVGANFNIIQGDRIGILVTEKSAVSFVAGGG
ncbi:MAG: hypothetical protein QXD77_00085 [Candidatus Aenigmatarchaeota archaeon]